MLVYSRKFLRCTGVKLFRYAFPIIMLCICLLCFRYLTTGSVQLKENKQNWTKLLYVDFADYLQSRVSDENALQLENYFTRSFEKHAFHCRKTVRILNGSEKAEGKYSLLCLSKVWPLEPPCLVYSFGITRNFSFDDAVTRRYGCEDYAFDPAIGLQSHNRSELIRFFDSGLWDSNVDDFVTSPDTEAAFHGHKKAMKLRTYGTLLGSLRHQERIIDYMNVDIGTSDVVGLTGMLNSGLLRNVKQLAVEFHPGHHGGIEVWSPILQAFFDQGFRTFSYENLSGFLNSADFSPHYRAHMVNINFLPTNS